MTAALVAGLLAGYGVAIPVGAIGALLVSLSARTSLRIGTAAALGVATTDGLYATAAVLGGAPLAALLAPAAIPLRWLAAVVLLALAVRTVWTAVTAHRQPASVARDTTGLRTARRAFLALLGLTALNPATIVYFGALVLGRQAAAPLHGVGLVVFVAAVFLASASWQLLLAASGSLVGRLVTGPRGRLVTALLSGAVIAVLALGLVT